MGRSRRPVPTAYSRRDVLRGIAVAGALPLLPACDISSRSSDGPTGPDAAPAFRHGVASGDPLADRIVLWTRVSNLVTAAEMSWELAEDAAFARVVRHSADGIETTPRQALPERDYTYKVDVAGLRPGTSYYYRFRCGTAVSPIGRTRTAPAGGAERARLAVVSCSNYATGFFNAYRVAARRDLDAVVHVGDYFYEGGGAGNLGRANDPPYEIVSLSDYRTRHALYRSDPDLQEMTRQHPLIAVWDDHESTNNSWADGAQNHQPETEGDWPTRKQIAVQAYEEWLPIRLPEPGNPLKIWRHLPFGDLFDLLMLDTRLQRNVPETDTSLTGTDSFDPARSMLGQEQREWLFATLRDSAARGVRWRVLGQQTMISPHRNNPDPRFSPLPYLPQEISESIGLRVGGGNEGGDNWGAYAFERDLIMRTLRSEGIANNVVLTGDIHTAWASDVTEDPYTLFNPLTPILTGVPGYNAITGQGSVAVEFTSMSVTSNNMVDSAEGRRLAPLYNAAVVVANPNLRFHNAAAHGFVLIDITRERVTGEFWNVGSVLSAFGPDDDAVLDAAFASRRGDAGAAGTDHLVRAQATEPRSDAPPPAP